MNKVKMTPVRSSQINSVGYDSQTSLLYIEFKNGSVYHYGPVDIRIYNDLLVPTVSVGKYFYEFIKGKFAYSKTSLEVVRGYLEEKEE